MTDAAPSRRHSRAGLIWPFAIVGLLLVLWTVWWFWLAREAETRLDQQAERMRASGWTVVYSDVGVSGWPFRARLETRNVSLQAPSTHGVAAPVLVVEANAYRPDRWVLIAPDGLVVSRAAKGKVALRGDAIRASASGLTQALPNLAVELINPVFTAHGDSEPFPLSRAGRIELYVRPHRQTEPTSPDAGVADAADVLFRMIDAEGRSGGAVEGLAQNGRLTAQVETVVTQASRLRQSRRDGLLAHWSAGGGQFLNVAGELSAGDSRALLASPVLSAGEDGRLRGTVSLTAERPLQALSGLARSRMPGMNPIGMAGAAAASAAGQTAAPERALTLDLRFENGRTFLGPFALAPAPRLF